MAGTIENLTPKQQTAIGCLLTEPSVTAAAAAAGVGERTLHRWLDDTAFAAAYRSARREAVQQAIARVQQTSGPAVTVLYSIATDTNALTSSRVAAASKILDLAIRAVELEDLEQRLAALEAAMKEQAR